MSIVDFIMRIVTVGLIIVGVIEAFAILLYLHGFCKEIHAVGMELLATMKAQGQPSAPDTEEEVFMEEEVNGYVTVQDDAGFHGRHHCSEGGEKP